MLDVAAHLGKETMSKYDLPYGGAVLAEEKHKPLFQEIMKHPTLQTTAGGSALNTIWCASVSRSYFKHMLKKRHPNSCLYFGAIGDDSSGEIVKHEMDKVMIFDFRREFKLIFVWSRGCQLQDAQWSSMRGNERSAAMSEQVLNINLHIWSKTCICLRLHEFCTQQASSLFLHSKV